MNDGTFTGKVTISVAVLSLQNHIAVHIKGLSITSTKLTTHEPETEISLNNTFEYKPNEFWVIELDKDLEKGRYKIFLEFNGSLTNKIVGFYRSVYKDIDGEEK